VQPSSSLNNPIEAIRQDINNKRVHEFNNALEAISASKEGRLFLAEIFRTFHMYTSPHNDHGSKTSFNCGQQSVCFQIRDWLKGADIYMKYWPLIEKDDLERSERWDNVFQEEQKKQVEKTQKRS
jgi:hypothetical protein